MSEEKTNIRVSDNLSVRRIVIDRADQGNMLTLGMVGQLTSVISDCSDDIKLIHLSGAGDDFCRGRDPKGSPAATSALEIRHSLIEPILSLYDAIANCPIPIVCSVQGAARGLGAALAAACDVSIAAANARFSLPEMEKDLPPTLAMSVIKNCILPRRLAHMVYGMGEIDAGTAAQLGLVSTVVASGSLETETSHLLATMQARSRPSLVAVKEYQRASLDIGPRAARDLAANLLASVLASAAK